MCRGMMHRDPMAKQITLLIQQRGLIELNSIQFSSILFSKVWFKLSYHYFITNIEEVGNLAL